MAVPAVQGSSIPEIVCGKDERVQVQPMTSPPYKWVCSLSIESTSGIVSPASGFKIHLPDVNRTAVVTSGHCTFEEGEYATKITVQFPGERAIDVGPADIYASPEYRASGSEDHDYGLILLPGASNDGFGWSAIVKDEELNNRLVTNCGYPGDKPAGTMWVTGGNITRVTANSIFYMNDTMAGQSGSPVYTWYDGYWTVLGIHSYGGCPNSATRFTTEMIYRFIQRMDMKPKLLRSVPFPDVYVRCDGTGVSQPVPAGSGTINCQYKPAKEWERFYICPVEMPPSSARESARKVVIGSVAFENVFIRMDGTDMHAPNPAGGGIVNCQFNVGELEVYILEEKNGSYSFRSVYFPNCYIRLDGSAVHSWSPSGGGTVNCQWYADPSGPLGSCETFHVEEQ